jgi:Holliday junction resolvasome RuvABC DNA-binding subunit
MSHLPQSLYYTKISKDTLFDFAKATYDDLPFYYKRAMTKQEIRELFAFVREENPALFEDFYKFNVSSMED